MDGICPLMGKWLSRCNFEPRYDKTIQRRELGMASDFLWETVTLPKGAPRQKIPTDTVTYVRDVCTRCGRTIERDAEPPSSE